MKKSNRKGSVINDKDLRDQKTGKKRPYTAPNIMEYGAIVDFTRDAKGTGNEGQSGMVMT